MLLPKTAHVISLGIGVIFMITAFYLAVFIKGSYFYTSFALGSWLILDFIDYKLNNTSILSYFYSHKHRIAFYLLFFISFFACFTIDFIWGVKILKLWDWVHYTNIEFIRMYLIMNITFVLGMYELYRVITTVFKPYVPEEHILNFRVPPNKKHLIYVILLLCGIISLVSPIYLIAFKIFILAPYLMIFPFMSIALITDSVTFLTHGQPILEDLIRFNRLKVSSILTTVLVAFLVTESLNLFGREWQYLQMPFYNIQILTVPFSVLIGWIPLVIGLISMVNMTKHLAYISSRH